MGLTQITTGGVDDNINIDSNTLKVDGTNNRVGIGTAAPTETLTLNTASGASIGFEHNGTEIATINNNSAALYCLLYTSPSPRDRQKSRMPSSA